MPVRRGGPARGTLGERRDFHSLLPQAVAETEGRSDKDKMHFFQALPLRLCSGAGLRQSGMGFLPQLTQGSQTAVTLGYSQASRVVVGVPHPSLGWSTDILFWSS